MNIFKQIKKNCLFQNFNDAEINKLFDCLSARMVKYSRGQLVAKENTEITELCILLEGNLVEFVTKNNGSREVLRSLVDGDMFGAAQGYSSPNLLGYYVVAALDSTVLYISIDSVVNTCESNCPYHKALITNLLRSMAEKIMDLENNNGYITIKGMRVKIAKFIYDKYCAQNTLNVSLGLNRNEMAKYLNVSRPSMSREMIRMRDEGIFDFWKDKITIKNLSALQQIVNNN